MSPAQCHLKRSQWVLKRQQLFAKYLLGVRNCPEHSKGMITVNPQNNQWAGTGQATGVQGDQVTCSRSVHTHTHTHMYTHPLTRTLLQHVHAYTHSTQGPGRRDVKNTDRWHIPPALRSLYLCTQHSTALLGLQMHHAL